MSAESKIQWTDATWNPVTGCTKISQGCKHCYAEVFAERFRGVKGHPFEQGFDVKLWPERLRLPLRWRKPRRIFVNSMSDLFHDQVRGDFILEVFATMALASQHTFQILTKRPERLLRMVPVISEQLELTLRHPVTSWPANIWIGVSVEDQANADQRIPPLLQVPAAVRFLSCEPLLGPLDLALARLPSGGTCNPLIVNEGHYPRSGYVGPIHWVIVGGESGAKARPMELAWLMSIKAECKTAGVPLFVKQFGAVAARRFKFADRKGGNPAEWPEWARVREFPKVEAL